MAIVDIEAGSKASSQLVNNNFHYLQDLVGQLSLKIDGSESTVDSKIATVKNTLTNQMNDLQTNVNTSIDELETKTSNLENNVDNKLNSIFLAIAPDLSAGVAVSSGFEAPANGWIIAILNSYDNYIKGYVDNVLVIQGTAAGLEGEAGSSTFFLIRKGQKLTFSRSGYNAKFYPCLGGQ